MAVLPEMEIKGISGEKWQVQSVWAKEELCESEFVSVVYVCLGTCVYNCMGIYLCLYMCVYMYVCVYASVYW